MQEVNVFSLRMIKERGVSYTPSVGRKMDQPNTVAEALDEIFQLGSLPEEKFVMLALDTKNQLMGAFVVSQGSINASIVHPREVFKRALLANSNAIILAHNHPSGDTTPSTEDLNITKRLVEAGNLLGIKVLDHIIVGHSSYKSFKEERWI